MELAKILAQQDVDLARLSTKEGRNALALYREARGELRDRLDSIPAGRFTAQHYRGALVQVHHAIQNLEFSLGAQLKDTVSKTANLSQEHLIRQATAFARRFHKSIEPTPLTLAAAVDEGRTLLLPQFDSSVRRYGQKLIGDIQHRLAVSMAAHESTDEMRSRIFSEYLQPLGSVKQGAREVPVTAYWAERLVRTEVGQAYNAMHIAQLSQQAYQTPRLMKCWSATMEKNTCDLCADMNGMVIPVREPFDLGKGRFVMGPLAHPNCQCTTVAWMAEWGNPLDMGIGEQDPAAVQSLEPVEPEAAEAGKPEPAGAESVLGVGAEIPPGAVGVWDDTEEGVLPDLVTDPYSEEQWSDYYQTAAANNQWQGYTYGKPAADVLARGRARLERGLDAPLGDTLQTLELLPDSMFPKYETQDLPGLTNVLEQLTHQIDQFPGGLDKYGDRTVREVANLVGKRDGGADGERLRAAGAIAQQMREVGHLKAPLFNQGVQFERLGYQLSVTKGRGRAPIPALLQEKKILSDGRLFHWRLGDGQIGIDESWKVMPPPQGGLKSSRAPLGTLAFKLPLETGGTRLARFAVPEGSPDARVVQRFFWERHGLGSEYCPNWTIRLESPDGLSVDKLHETTGALIHEMTHALDSRYEKLDDGAISFLKGRAMGRQDVDIHLKDPRYAANNLDVVDDELIKAYSGRTYPRDMGRHEGSSTEAFSTGAQNLYERGLDFYLDDKHHFLFALGTLR